MNANKTKNEETKPADPFGILASTEEVMRRARHVSIDSDKISAAAERVRQRLEAGLEKPETSFGSTGRYEDDCQLVFLLDSVNFCFWPDATKPKWRVNGTGGWYSLVNCFARSSKRGIPILDAAYLSNLPIKDARAIFLGDNGVEIPMLTERANNLREAGKVLAEKFGGRFINALQNADFDVVEIVRMLYENFSSFRDEAVYDNKSVRFLKRAQICAMDLSYVAKGSGRRITNTDRLTAFADYRLPQILRHYGALVYASALAESVDNCREIKAGSRDEIEIRAATVQAVERMRRRLVGHTAAEIDNALWLLSQQVADLKPHHRTRTINY